MTVNSDVTADCRQKPIVQPLQGCGTTEGVCEKYRRNSAEGAKETDHRVLNSTRSRARLVPGQMVESEVKEEFVKHMATTLDWGALCKAASEVHQCSQVST